MGAFFQELTPEIKVTVEENSERHSMTTTYIQNLTFKIDLAPGKLLEFEKSALCSGIVLEFCKVILENMN